MDEAAIVSTWKKSAARIVVAFPARNARQVCPDRVPAQHGPRGDDRAQLTEMTTGQQPGQRGQDRPVSPGQSRGLGLALEHGDLMAQDEDLGILGLVGPGGQDAPRPAMTLITALQPSRRLHDYA